MRNKVWMFIAAIALLVFSIGNVITMFSITGGATSTTSFCFNNPPTIITIPSLSDHQAYVFLYDVNATDADNDSFTFTDNSSIFAISTAGLINFTPSLGHFGNHTIKITAIDNFSECPGRGHATFVLQITNQKPILSGPIANQ